MPRAKARVRDWLFGARGKRRLLALLVDDPTRAWRQAELAKEAGLHPKGSVDEHLLALAQIGLVSAEGGRYRFDARHPLAAPLMALLTVVEDLPDAAIKRPAE